MNILIVDDDAYVIEALQKGIDWHQLEIDQVFTAYNVKKAKQILESETIHILLCDIEMPKESGLSLLKWVREKNFLIQNIFLTSYGDFEYASQAIELQTFSYALKPIAYDKLKVIIQNAVEKEKQMLKALDYQKGYKSWIDTTRDRKEYLWQKILVEKSMGSMVEIIKFCNEMEIAYRTDSNFICVSVELFHYKEIYEQLGDDIFTWLRGFAKEFFQAEKLSLEGVVKKDRAEYVFILLVTEDFSLENVRKVADNVIAKIGKDLQCKACCGIGNVCIISQLADNLIFIEKMCRNNVVEKNKTLLLSEYEYTNITYEPPNFDMLESLLSEEKEEDCIMAMNEYLDRLIQKNKVNKEILYQLMMDFSQTAFSVHRKNHFMFHAWQYERFQGKEMEEAIISVEHLRVFLKELIRDTVGVIKSKPATKSIVEMVVDYIEHNIEKDISRESLAELVYLNPDYLARLFKKEIGESIGSYIINRRIGIAKEYFENTNEPINVVAIKVGYDNFSYFSKIFKEVTGFTPKEYKKNYEKGKAKILQ